MNTAFQKYAAENFDSGNVLLLEPMAAHTTFKVGGAADFFIKISSRQQLVKTVPYLNALGLSYFVLGNGSNLLVSDNGYQGVILQIGAQMGNITVDGTKITVQAGASLAKLAKTAMEHGLGGLEFASGIPGTVGGAVMMNAGAYGGEMEQVVSSVTVLAKDGSELTLSHDDMEFSYRSSILKNRSFIILEAEFTLQPGDSKQIQAKMEEYGQSRREKQPLQYPSAGSTFKRPDGCYAGKLIMDAGLRGYRIGGAQVSEKHCGFIVNVGNAQASDIYELIQEVQESVYEKFGVRLEPEIIMLGEFA